MLSLYTKDSFLSSYEALDDVYKNRAIPCLAEFMCSMFMQSKNLEKLSQFPSVYSLRLTDKYRIMVKKISNDVYILLYVGNHDIAYDWLKKNKKHYKKINIENSDYEKIENIFPEIIDIINKYTNGNIEMSAAETIPENTATNLPENKGILKAYSNKELLRGLLDQNELEIVRNWTCADDYEKEIGSLSVKSQEFIKTLMHTGRVDEAVNSLRIVEQHETIDKQISETIKAIKNYKKKLTSSPGQTHPIKNKILNQKTAYYAGLFGGGKTLELIDAIKINENYFRKEKSNILFVVSEPDYYLDTLAYIHICFDEIPDFLTVMTFDQVLKAQISECSKRWKLDFQIEKLEEGTELMDIFAACAISIDSECSKEDIDLYLSEWNTIVEEYGTYTPAEYFSTPRIGAVEIDEVEKMYMQEFIRVFVDKMKETGIYTPGFALAKFANICKKKSYRPYSIIYADDIQCLTQKQLQFLAQITKESHNLFTFDYAFYVARPDLVYSNQMLYGDLASLVSTRSTRVTGAKSIWLSNILSKTFINGLPDVLNISELRKKSKDQDNLINIQFEGSYEKKNSIYLKLKNTLSSIDNPEQTVIVVSDEKDIEDLVVYLNRQHIPFVVIDDDHPAVDYLIDAGVRICTLRRLGCMAFENVILLCSDVKTLTESEDVPEYAQLKYKQDKILARTYLFIRAVCASFKNTYFFSSNKEQNIIQLLE